MSVETHERHSDAIEDYAKAIYALSRRGGGVVSTNALARRRQLDTLVGDVRGEPALGELLDHRRRGCRGDAEALR